MTSIINVDGLTGHELDTSAVALFELIMFYFNNGVANGVPSEKEHLVLENTVFIQSNS